MRFQTLLDSGKAEYKRQVEVPDGDFSRANYFFEQAVKQQPNNTTARYFYGYNLDKLNSPSGETMDAIQVNRTIAASEQFEFINKVEPAYKGEMLVLDPYSKVQSIWGSQALAFLNRGQRDSARWALKEGKKRGGFLDPVLAFNRSVLKSCANDAILVMSGDNVTFPILYLQEVENLRPDVKAIDGNLLHSKWYPKYIKRDRVVPISFDDQQLDTLSYSVWEPMVVKITDHQAQLKLFIWTVKPTYYEKYILRGDRVLLDIFQQTIFKRPIYFSEAKPDSSMNLSLGDHLFPVGVLSMLVVDETTFNKGESLTENLKNYTILPEHAPMIRNSSGAITLLNAYRFAYYERITDLLDYNKTEAKRLFEEMQAKFPESLLPYEPNLKEYEAQLAALLSEK